LFACICSHSLFMIFPLLDKIYIINHHIGCRKGVFWDGVGGVGVTNALASPKLVWIRIIN
jgi:hypothetical protein